MERVITKHFDVPNMRDIGVARQHGAYLTLKKLERMKPRDVIAEVIASELRGRGGAGFPVGKKWSLVPSKSVGAVSLVVNADESDPGTFKDRSVIERDPHLLVEGMIIAARAIDAKVAYAYFRAEYLKPMENFMGAVEEARRAGFIGEGSLLEDVRIYRGAGAYVCGEESALIGSIEGRRGMPNIKPPYPVERGLYDSPTVVNNVETLATLPYIIREGAEKYRELGTEKSRGTKLVSISGCVKKAGVYEVEMGTPVSILIRDEAGGIQDGQTLKAVIPGGISTAVLTASEALACTTDFESMSEAGSALGSGGMVVMDEGVSMVSALADIAKFFAHESCGKCTPCREGTGWIMKVLRRIEAGSGRHSDLNLICDLATGMGASSLCPLAESLAVPVLSFTAKFRGEFQDAINGLG